MTPTPTPESSDIPHPLDLLLNLIVTCLAPMFLTTAGGNIHVARQAAIQTVNAYRARDHADLLAIAQIIACGLTALGSLSLSLGDDLSLSMILRLRGNAVSLNRAAEQNRRALATSRPAAQPTPEPEDPDAEEKILANVAATQELAVKIRTDLQPTAQAPTVTPRQQQAMWAFAMTDVAAEVTATLKNLPPTERKLASRRAAALSTCANQLLLGNVPPPLQPGDLAAILASAKTG